MSKKPALRPQGAVGDALRAAARDILGHAGRALDGPTDSETVAIHEFRKACKHWRALLRLIEPLIGTEARSLRLEASELARTLGHARDGQAALDALADIGEGNAALSARSVETMRARLQAFRATAETNGSLADVAPRLRDYLHRAGASVEQWVLHRFGFDDTAACLAATYRQARRAVPDDWSAAHPDELHKLRRRIVEHRYQFELIEPLWPRMGRLWVEEAQRLRNRLGAYQDLVVLEGLTAPHGPLAPWRSRLVPLIAARQAAHLRSAARMTARLLAEKPKALRRRLKAMWAAGASGD
jgi:CHAD domain-containing protein